MPKLEKGIELFRNLDIEFIQSLSKKSAERKVYVDLNISEFLEGFLLIAKDENGNSVEQRFICKKEKAQNEEKAFENIKTQLSKWGNSIFEVRKIEMLISESFFIPNSVLSDWRRELMSSLDQKRLDNYVFDRKSIVPNDFLYPQKELSYLANVYNKLAKSFYSRHGLAKIDDAFEKLPPQNSYLMFCKHCLKYSVGLCPQNSSSKLSSSYREPFFLVLKNKKIRLAFDCKMCQMCLEM
jgi:putative protease